MNVQDVAARPCFRTDLVAQPVADAGQRFVDVTDPDSGKTFRFYEVEYSLACAMDGRRDVRELADWALDELGLQASREELESVIGTLADLGYLEGQGGVELSNVPVVADEVELGASGGVNIAGERAAEVTADALELGAPGRGAVPRARPVMPSPEPVELGTAGPPGAAAKAGAEDSFEGLMEEPATEVRHVPSLPPRKAPPPPPAAAAQDDFMDTITPPPQEEPSATLRPSTSPTDEGPTFLPAPSTDYDEEEVSVDLSAHLSIGAEDVKEAVRQSRAMAAVELPPELAAELEGTAPPPMEAPMAPMAEVSSTPIELPERPVVRRDEPVVPPTEKQKAAPRPAKEKRSGVSPILIFLLILVLGGAGAYYYFFVYKKDHETQTAKPGPTVKPGPGGKQPGVKPPGGEQPGVKPPGGEQPGVKPPPGGQEPTEVTAVLEQGAAPAASTEITAPADGPVVWVADNGAQVNAGDDVVRLRDYTKFEKNMAEATDRLAHYQQQLDAANKKLAEGKPGADKRVAEAQAKVKEKQDLITAAKDGMAKATITAPVGGTVEQVVKPRQWANAGKPILRITGGQAPLTATFTVGDGKTFATGSTVSLTSDQGPVDCKVASYTAGKLAVTCPSGTLKAGAKLTLKP